MIFLCRFVLFKFYFSSSVQLSFSCAGVQPSVGGGNAFRGSEEPETTAGRRQPAGYFFQQDCSFWLFPTNRLLFSTKRLLAIPQDILNTLYISWVNIKEGQWSCNGHQDLKPPRHNISNSRKSEIPLSWKQLVLWESIASKNSPQSFILLCLLSICSTIHSSISLS